MPTTATKTKTKPTAKKTVSKASRPKPTSKRVAASKVNNRQSTAVQSKMLSNDMMIVWVVLIIVFLLFVIKVYGV